MKILVAEDDLASRKLISKFLSNYGVCDVTVNGIEVLEAFVIAMDLNKPYDLVCLDVMMPRVDGVKALRTIRALEEARDIEESKRVKIIITTALGKTDYVMSAIKTGLEVYVSKPLDLGKMEEAMKKLGLI